MADSLAVSRSKRKYKNTDKKNDSDELLVFGYASKIYGSDERMQQFDEERHLIAHPANAQLLIDRQWMLSGARRSVQWSDWMRPPARPIENAGQKEYQAKRRCLALWCHAIFVSQKEQESQLYDCRLHLTDLGKYDNFVSDETCVKQGSDCPTETLEEEMCEEERYKDLHLAIDIENVERAKRARAEISFNYEGTARQEESSSSEEEVDEPFLLSSNIKLPVGMNLPKTMKENAVIERTATFVVAQGPQMEIVIKAKQRGNAEKFEFLEFDHPLNAYYKYISKMIREKKYEPKLHKPSRRPKYKKQKRLEEQMQKAVIEQGQRDASKKDENCASDSDDSNEGDHYLHPLLMGGSASTSSLSKQLPVIGPKTREEHEAVPMKATTVKSEYSFKANAMYSSLFKNLSDLVMSKAKTEKVDANKDSKEKGNNASIDNETEKCDYVDWYLSFYGEPPPNTTQPTIIPPTPDLMPIVNSAAEYVAHYGCQAEHSLSARGDLTFLNTSSQYYSYYQSRVRYYQWMQASAASSSDLMTNCAENDDYQADSAAVLDSNGWQPSAEDDFNDVSTSPLSDFLQAPPPPPHVGMNRKMRRRGFHDPPQKSKNIAQIGLVEPFVQQLGKVHSSPAILDVTETDNDKSVNMSKKSALGPISFSLNLPKNEEKKSPSSRAALKLGAYDDDESVEAKAFDAPAGVITNIPPPGLTIPPPPVAPVPLSTGKLALEGSAELQTERKLKARLFMEKILNEKRAAKLKAQIAEQQKLDSTPAQQAVNPSQATITENILAAANIDQLINSRIDKLLVKTLNEKLPEIVQKETDHSKNEKIAKKEKKKDRSNGDGNKDKFRRAKKQRSPSLSKSEKKKMKKRSRCRSGSSDSESHRRKRHKNRSRSRSREYQR